MTEPTCPTPAKSRFATETAAQLAAARYGKALHAYGCSCGWYHLTSKPAPAAPVEDPTVTQQVTALDDGEFLRIVGSEVRGQATPQQAAALRHRINLDRWLGALANLNLELQQQLAARKGDHSEETNQWRQRILRVQQFVNDRRTEAKKLRCEAHLAWGREQERLRLAGTTGAEARAAAGERAIDRLIGSHRAEFDRLLVEEFERAGLEVPTRIARHAARNAAAEAA
jgi:hypothetical protein